MRVWVLESLGREGWGVYCPEAEPQTLQCAKRSAATVRRIDSRLAARQKSLRLRNSVTSELVEV